MPSVRENPERAQVLMLGQVHHASDTFKELKSLFSVLQITSGTRKAFLEDCAAGVYDGVVAIARTVDSAKVTGVFDTELVEALPPSVRFVCHNGAGYDQINTAACAKQGIQVSNTPSVVNGATADTTMLLLLAALRRAWIPQRAARKGLWDSTTPLGRDPKNLTLGILGMGGIGLAVAKRAAAFDLRLQYHNRSPANPLDLQNLCLAGCEEPELVDLETLFRTSDIISVHIPLSDKTRGFIGKKEIDRMKDRVIIINTARGPIIDEEALVQGLESGKVWSAGLDVYEHEPSIHPALLANDNVILLPHIGTATEDTRKRMEILLLENVKSALTVGRLTSPIPEHM